MNRIFANMPPVTKNLLIINVLIWGAMALIPALDVKLTKWCALHFFTSPGFNAAQLVTYMFLHAGMAHLFFNMFALVMFGGVIERTMGPKRFLTYYLSCGIFAALVQMAVYAIVLTKYTHMFPADQLHEAIVAMWDYMNGKADRVSYSVLQIINSPEFLTINSLVNGPMVGASGAIYGIILAFGMLYPNQPLYLFFIPVPIKAKYLVIGYGVLELCLGLGSMSDNIAHFAHLGGMIAGIILIIYWKKKGVFNNHWFF